MPELPEVEALTRWLDEELAGRTVERVDVAALQALKTYDPPIDSLAGRAFTGSGRRGKHVLLGFGDRWLVVHLSRAGWVKRSAKVAAGRPKPGKGPLALRLVFDDGSGLDFTEAGTEKRLAAWLVTDPGAIAGIATLGPDPLDPAFDADALAAVLHGQRAQVKKVLTDQSLIAGVGNAYSDEALHLARLSPFKLASSLTPEEVGRLHTALTTVLSDAVERSRGLPASGLKDTKRAGMRVHGRTGEACPACGDVVREVAFASRSLQYCATCQTGGKPLADRRLSRLLK